MKRVRDTAAKGRKLVLYVRDILLARGYRVEIAQNVLVWWFDAKTHRRVPRSVHHDMFGCFDILAVSPSGSRRRLIQVTTLQNLAAHRVKILAAGRWHKDDAILAWVPGRGRHFRVFRGPEFATQVADVWYPVKRTPKRRAA